ncbi:hypothetical protein PQR14_35335 [Paraburkholderia bryophila]|uniref:hypothetical protein n=1 Tax=Paraburkholderia bryophila TaxID=420952 RepID=UPI0038BD231F
MLSIHQTSSTAPAPETASSSTTDGSAAHTPSGAPSSTSTPVSLEALTTRRVSEQASFDKWNPNAQGRNQGLVHVIDYAYARPPSSKVDKRLLQPNVMGQQHSLTGAGILQRLKEAGEPDTAESFKPDKMGLVSFNPRDTEKITQKRNELNAFKKSEAKAGRIKEPETRKNIEKLEGEVRQLEVAGRRKSSYVFQTDDSKRGRIDLIDKSAGRAVRDANSAPPDRNMSPLGRSEISDVTSELDRLKAHPDTAHEQTEATGEPRTLKRWAKTKEGDGNKAAEWREKEESVIDQSVSSTHRTDSNGAKLNIKSWGPNADSLKYSTAMGS